MAKRIYTCTLCGIQYVAKRESSRFCSKRCFGQSNIKEPPPCVIDDCDEVCDTHRGGAKGMCAKHRARVVRNGSPDRTPRPPRKLKPEPRAPRNPSLYRRVRSIGHALADARGWVAEHRMVLFDIIGPGIHSCAWCGRSVEWRFGTVGSDVLVVDHVDGDTHNNDSSNLVPSCHRCNGQRGGHPNSKKTHCPRGHEYAPENTDYFRGARYCRACKGLKPNA